MSVHTPFHHITGNLATIPTHHKICFYSKINKPVVPTGKNKPKKNLLGVIMKIPATPKYVSLKKNKKINPVNDLVLPSFQGNTRNNFF